MKNVSTLCTYTTCGSEIEEGHILGYGDNYACLVVYNPFEAQFEALEFGYEEEGYLYRTHGFRDYTRPWKILGRDKSLLSGYPSDFNYLEELKKAYPEENIE